MRALLPYLFVTAATAGVLWLGWPSASPRPAAEPLPWTPPLNRARETGRRIYLRRCVWCHGPERDGFGLNATKLATPPPDLRAHSKNTIRNWLAGRRPRPAPLCPDWSGTLTPPERNAVAEYAASP